MREVLFKAKRVDNGTWVEGLLWKKKYNDGNRIFISCFPDKDDNEEVYVVCPETLCQFTGLCDKNGKRIFEGDIVKIDGKNYEVQYLLGQFFVGINMPIAYKRFECEVIENRFDNPELLTAERIGENENITAREY